MEKTGSRHLIIFTRYPKPGVTKTRLISVLRPQGAARLQRRMTEHLLSQIRPLLSQDKITIEIRFEGGDESLMRQWLGSDYSYSPQGEGDLGFRMQMALKSAFLSGATAVVIMGSDIPGITADLLKQALDALNRKKMVIGPAKDGGYYLIGFNLNISLKDIERILTGIQWGTGYVFKKTLKIANDIGITFLILKLLEDIDRPEDLRVWERLARGHNPKGGKPRISIIIPTLNEADNIEKTLASIGKKADVEIIVVDGGSEDDTFSRATAMGAWVITAPPPKARQMNRGAAEATGDIFLFLHADTCLPVHFHEKILKCLQTPGVSAGAFKLGIDSPRAGLRFIEFFANLRSVYLKLPYGDQGIFTTARLFYKLGGYAMIPLMEDYEMIRRFKKKGHIMILPTSVLTSPRRWRNLGIFKTWLVNQMTILAYHMGVAPPGVARLYNLGKGSKTNKENPS